MVAEVFLECFPRSATKFKDIVYSIFYHHNRLLSLHRQCSNYATFKHVCPSSLKFIFNAIIGINTFSFNEILFLKSFLIRSSTFIWLIGCVMNERAFCMYTCVLWLKGRRLCKWTGVPQKMRTKSKRTTNYTKYTKNISTGFPFRTASISRSQYWHGAASTAVLLPTCLLSSIDAILAFALSALLLLLPHFMIFLLLLFTSNPMANELFRTMLLLCGIIFLFLSALVPPSKDFVLL